MSRVVVLTTEPLPLPGWPTTGAGLRAWEFARALGRRGHDVLLMMPDDAIAGFAPAADAPPPVRTLPEWIGTFSRSALRDDPRPRSADAIVLQHWGLARDLGETSVPLAIDLAGPHLLERRLWGSPSFESDVLEKLDALRRADFLTASGRDQRLYFLPWLALAGWETSGADPLPVVPYSLPLSASPAPARGDRFFYGGFFLPWQDPSVALRTALEEMDRAGAGELVFVGGTHPTADVSRGRFDEIARALAAHPRVRAYDPTSYDAYLALLAEGGVALDLMARNAERELAFTTRTVRYMASGLPVVHDDYSELGRMIADSGAGWTFDPDSAEGVDRFRKLMRGLLSGEIDPSPQAAAARRLVAERLSPDETIEPLDRFCREPRARPGKESAILGFEARERRLLRAEEDLRRTRSRLDTLLGKRWVRWGLAATSGAAWTRPLAALLAGLAGLALLPVFAINDFFAGARRRR